MDGSREWLNCRNATNENVLKWVEFLKSQNGSSSSTRLRKMWHTDKPSIQGPWTPFTLRCKESQTINYPNSDQSRSLDFEKSATEKLMEIFKEQSK